MLILQIQYLIFYSEFRIIYIVFFSFGFDDLGISFGLFARQMRLNLPTR
jgi:hypothetical protein